VGESTAEKIKKSGAAIEDLETLRGYVRSR
jgi:hypothetical protein